MDIECYNQMYASKNEMKTEEMMVKRRNTRLPLLPQSLAKNEKIQVNHEDKADRGRKTSLRREM